MKERFTFHGRGKSHLMHPNSIRSYKELVLKLIHLKHKKRVEAFLKATNEPYTRRQLSEILHIEICTLCGILTPMKDIELVSVSDGTCKTTGRPVEHFQWNDKKKEPPQKQLL
jgi:chromosome segregation and condensation protein ScpB